MTVVTPSFDRPGSAHSGAMTRARPYRPLALWGAVTALTVSLGLPAAEADVPGPRHAAAAAASAPGVPWTWGGNSYGELGSGTTQSRLTPGPVTGLADVVDLHGGREHVAALREDGTVWTWGSNRQGQLGLGTTANRTSPARVSGINGATAVETGHNHSLALLADGTVRTWGLNADGQLGDGSTTLRRSPVTVVGLDDAVAIAAGRNMSFALRADGTVVGWGRNDEGQLGDGTRTRRLTPVRVGSLTGVVGIAGGRDHGLALRTDGTVWAWGSNNYGQVGNGTTADQDSPVQVTNGISQVIAGAHHSYALRADGTVAAWGRNYRANLGDGSTAMRTRPVSVRTLASIVSIGSGRDTGVAVRADGRVLAWGGNSAGQVGDGTTTNRSTPALVPGVTDAVLAGGGGAAYSVVVVADGAPPVPQDPVAAFTSSCSALTCTLDGSGSFDQDGPIAGYAWNYGDGQGASGPAASRTHTYATAGTYRVTLTVTDGSGATDSVSHDIAVQDAPTGTGPAFWAAASSDSNTARPSVGIPGSVRTTDRLVLVVTTNRTATLTTPSGWTLAGTVTDGTEVRSWVLTRAAGGIAGSTLTLTLDARSKTGLVLLAYAGAAAPSAAVGQPEGGSGTSHTAPAAPVAQAGSTVVRYYADKTSTVHGWTLPPVLTQRAATTGSGGGMLTSVAGDQGGVPPGTVPALAATAGASASKAVAWTIALPPS